MRFEVLLANGSIFRCSAIDNNGFRLGVWMDPPTVGSVPDVVFAPGAWLAYRYVKDES